ncbi:hypothetical protein A4X13_0g1132 [Tilletia indica]|uniref:Disease resistance R13L4/SHOC-2-like LRR domain-containing protein n=1 Tax=Tilletia indica TaxID=43049 RepID=A0A177TX86_9BASI|nr:hypothetical protein A4X13_0g1132 [Tilletia indica]
MSFQTSQDGFYFRRNDTAEQQQQLYAPQADRLDSQHENRAAQGYTDGAAAEEDAFFDPFTPTTSSNAIFASPAVITPYQEPSISDSARLNGSSAGGVGGAASSMALREAVGPLSASESASGAVGPQLPQTTAPISGRHTGQASFERFPVPPAVPQNSTSPAVENASGAINAPQRKAPSEASRASMATSKRSVPPITDQELLQVVLDMRERASRPQQRLEGMDDFRFPSGSNPASAKGKQSPERSASVPRPGSRDSKDIDTLDLTAHGIVNLPELVIEHIKHDVVRLSLATNRLTKLPTAFADLRRLKYLNIRHNGIKEVPSVICELPALEILDMARNKIRMLPESPGNLINLRILAIGDNRLERLPAWLGRMKKLRTVRLTPNPLQWPPAEVMQGGGDHQTEQRKLRDPSISAEEKDRIRRNDEAAMSRWISKLQGWINANSPSQPAIASEAQGGTSFISANDASTSDAAAVSVDVNGANVTSSPPRIRRVSPQEASRSITLSEQIGDNDQQDVSPITPQPEHVEQIEDLPDLDRESQYQGESGSSRPGTSDRPSISDLSQTLDRPSIERPSFDRPSLSEASMAASISNFRQMLAVSNGHQRDGSVTSMSSVGSRSFMSRGASSTTPVAGKLEDRAFLVANRMVPTLSHMRNNSHSIGQANPRDTQKGKVILKGKKSLPDLRQNDRLIQERQQINSRVDESFGRNYSHRRIGSASSSNAGDGALPVGVDGVPLPKRPINGVRRPPLPHPVTYSPGQTSATLSGSGSMPRRPSLAATAPPSPADDYSSSPTNQSRTSPITSLPRDTSFASSISSRRRLILVGPPNDLKQVREAADPLSPSAQAEAERNSYFRRLSMLPSSTINKAVPQAVLDVVDATRGVLYALSQIHSALKQYIMFAVVPATTASGVSTDDGRVSAPINRVLDIASASMAHFIDALDRFDSMCRRGTPPAIVVRDVFLACKDSVQIFRKVIGVLQLQLRALLNTADVRYTRTLLLMLFGSIAEVSNSYRTLGPQIEALMPYLSGTATANGPSSGNPSASASFSSMNGIKSGRAVNGGLGHVAAGSTFSTPSLPSIAEQASPSKTRPLITAHRPARNRHAGNFSARDVEQGAMIAPANHLSSSGTSKAGGAPTGNMEQLINEEKRRMEAGGEGDDDFDLPPVPPLPLSEISIHLNNSGRSRSGSGTGSENGQLLSASSSTGSGMFDTVSSSGGLVSGSYRRQAPSGLGTLPSIQNYQDEVAAGFPRSPGGRPIMLASANGFGPRRGESGSQQHEAQQETSADGRKEYFDHAYSRSLPSRPVRRGRTGSSASAGSAGANPNGTPAVVGWGGGGQPPLPPTRPHTAGNTSVSGASRPRTAGSASGRRDRDRTPVADDHLLMLTDQLTTTASAVWGSLEGYLEMAAQQQEQNEEQLQQQAADTSTGSAGANGTSGGSLLSRRMRDLNVQLSGASTLTDQLQGTLETIRASLDGDAGGVPDSGMSTVTSTNLIKQPAAEIKKLWEDGNILVRTVVQVSTLIRGITSEHDFPREVLRSMGELTSVCSQLMVHMHFLQPGNTGAPFSGRSASGARGDAATVAG